ncbi:response regulator [Bifidobacterium platyrrhinorum]|uniref:Response regulator n=1 Tax=Bifidobacterium platyrrhinorum TaxID=2661628 RepID=A0A6L9SQ86_9BIFI|nr:response regulator transcription factor [Bifidobacterium platyrrhinorum]NEG54654.1 response regulator [Bifidobacterium platyrrhinorum]
MAIRVLIVDDQPMFRMGLQLLLETVDGIDVTGEAEDGGAALAFLESTPVDVVLMDVRMPVMDGVEATRRIRAEFKDDAPRVLMLTTFALDEYVIDAMEAGVSGFLLKDAPLDELVSAIRHVEAGDAVVSPRMTARLLGHFLSNGSTKDNAGNRDVTGAVATFDLTDRETEVFRLIGLGLSNGQIADRLRIAENTVRVHVRHVLDKTGSCNRVQAAVLAYRIGLVSADDR